VAANAAWIPAQPAKVAPFAGGNEADVRQNRGGRPAVPSEQKSRLLLAATKLMSAKIAAEDQQCPASKSHAFCSRQRS
jgi:hypothetical protein